MKQGGAERRIEREGSAERRASPLRCVWKTELQTAVEVLVRQLLPQLDIVRIVRRTALRRQELFRGWGALWIALPQLEHEERLIARA